MQQDDAGHTSFHFAREGSQEQAVGRSERYADLQSSDPARYSTSLIGKRSEKSDDSEGRSNVCSDLCEMMMRH